MLTSIPGQYREAGRITSEVRAAVNSKVKPGMTYTEICDFVECEIASRGGKPAFPTGVGVNQVTAHYAPQEDDTTMLRDSDVVKVDFGVHVDGYVADTATTLSFGTDHELLLDATQKALDAAVSMARHETRTGEIGREVKRVASMFGFKTIENLTGHTVDRFVVHAGKSIPNLYMSGMQPLRKGDVFAIEPFLTLGSAAGYVVDSPSVTIYSLVARRKLGSSDLDSFMDRVWEDRKTLPFTPRWYVREFGKQKLREILSKLVSKRVVRAYPTLVEASGKPVAQFEQTMALGEEGLVVLT